MSGNKNSGVKPGTKNAEKWFPDEINKFLEAVYNYIDENVNCVTLTEATLECGQYEQILRYFETKDNPEINFAPIKKAKDILKNRIIKNAILNKYNPTMAIFVLKNDYGMKDKQETDLTLNNTPQINISIDGKIIE